MRISVLSDDPGYDELRSIHTKVFFNAQEIQGCLTADEEEGSILVLVYDENNRVIIDGNNAMREILYGDVKIVLPTEH